MWAMDWRRPDGAEWPLETKLDMIHEAGFDGAGVRFFDRDHVSRVTGKLRDWGLTWQAQCYPRTIEDLGPILDNVARFGADHVNLQADVRPQTVAECVPLVEGWLRMGEQAAVPVHLETHRDRMTTDLLFTLRLLDRFPDLRLTGDLSHYVMGREFAWPISEENHQLMHRIIDNCWGFHGRIASLEQIQVQISFAHQKDWLDLFMGWWAYGFRSWRRRAPEDAVLTFLCQLGPREYAMTGPDGYELSDRWQESKTLMRMVRDLWQRLEQEATVGLVADVVAPESY
jgi:hypothetical protein